MYNAHVGFSLGAGNLNANFRRPGASNPNAPQPISGTDHFFRLHTQPGSASSRR
jgi:hypothetical protein